ncbi:MAG TPA: hypothetical protein DDY50_13790 [Erwinia persicina]|nr:hypothetical protein [Erwinia persicina]
MKTLFSQLPSIDRLLRQAEFQALSECWGHEQVVTLLRQLQKQAREHIRQHQHLPDWCSDWAHHTHRLLKKSGEVGRAHG